jgi:hypothetical protein
MKENYKSHLDFNAVKKYSELDATKYNTTRPLKPNERAELIEKIVRSRERYPVQNYKEDDTLTSTAAPHELALRLCPHPQLGG